MPGIRALSGYMDAFVGAEQAEQDRMLQEMKQLLEVGKGVTTIQATQQGMRVAGAQEARTAELHPVEMDVRKIARDVAFEALQESARLREHEGELRPLELRRETAGAVTAEAGAEYAGRREAASVGDLEKRLQESNLRFDELLKSIERGEAGRRAVAARGLPSPEEAAMGAPGMKFREELASSEARLRFDLPFWQAAGATSDAELNYAMKQIKLNTNWAPEKIRLELDLVRAQIQESGAKAKAALLKSGEEFSKLDLYRMLKDTALMLTRIQSGLSVEKAREMFPTSNPMWAYLPPYLTDTTVVTEAHKFMAFLKNELLKTHGISYDFITEMDEDGVPININLRELPPGSPQLGTTESPLPMPGRTPAVAPEQKPVTPPAPAPGGWDVDWGKTLEGLQRGTPQQ